jgi:hypothetical protein
VEVSIGSPPWDRTELLESLSEFNDLYRRRPLRDNPGGMRASHMFATWVIVRNLQPDLIVESGVWRGQGTWLLEQACPSAELISIDPDLSRRTYISSGVHYQISDFNDTDWVGRVTSSSLAFFDDHVNAYSRLQQAYWTGFKHVIFEDNYPPELGDMYSLKKVWAGSGHHAPRPEGFRSGLRRVRDRIMSGPPEHVEPTSAHASATRQRLETYAEFPPIVRTPKTRWGTPWDESFGTVEPLLSYPGPAEYRELAGEGEAYQWLCYVKLR